MGESDTTENSLRFMSPRVAVNRVFYANDHPNAVVPAWRHAPDPVHHFQSPHGHLSEDWARGKLLQHREPERRGATSAGGHRPRPDGCCLHPAPTRHSSSSHARGDCSCWNCRSNQWGATQAANSNSHREERRSVWDPQNDEEEELEAPLPLRDENDWDNFCPRGHSQHFMHTRDGGRSTQTNHDQNPASSTVLQPCHHFVVSQHNWRSWDHAPYCVQRFDTLTGDSPAHAAVSVNVPRFSVPPAEDVSRVGVPNLISAGGNASASHPQQRRRTVSLPEDCRKVFITYSSDVSSEILSFVDFLTKQGLQPAIDLLDDPVRSMDINKWNDSNLKDPLTLIIIAISPKYKSDIEGPAADSHALHNKYIHSMMQNEFIQQGSLNFRFIPVLFLGVSQKLVPTWLQNTRVYRWPQDTDDLLLRMLREERYAPPSVPVDLTLVITPVTSPASPTL